MRIPAGLLREFRKLLGLETEVCGKMLIHENNICLVGITKGTTDAKGRHLCISEPADYVWHTHPNTHKAYPSAEDIMSVVKNRKPIIKISIIITAWGIWVLQSQNKIHITDRNRDYYQNKIQKIINTLYFYTEKGRVENVDESQVCSAIFALEGIKGLGLQIRFRKWESVTTDLEVFPAQI